MTRKAAPAKSVIGKVAKTATAAGPAMLGAEDSKSEADDE
jgi:hypothetical protein